ncbi:REP-associated tyrosine transposase [Guptibacillus hwajinpoensis]|uniref:REP-associated tyrosine transposase n=1 Tax=Guptibacillus hwajinpoensis TaxID=208199 RepID=UPI0031FED8FB
MLQESIKSTCNNTHGMVRKPRVWLPNHFYHIVSRGNRKELLFYDNRDYRTFLSILDQVFETHPFELASYCLMNNHYHLQLRSKEHSISKIMSLINKRYATYFNGRYELTGHVFEKRYFDEPLNSSTNMLEVSRYIHLNPVKANLVSDPEDYPWSSYHYYRFRNKTNKPYLYLLPLIEGYPGTIHQKKKQYCKFVMARRDVIVQSLLTQKEGLS